MADEVYLLTVFENQSKCLIHLNIDFNAKNLCERLL